MLVNHSTDGNQLSIDNNSPQTMTISNNASSTIAFSFPAGILYVWTIFIISAAAVRISVLIVWSSMEKPE